MAPARTIDEDPVTAEYDVYITSPLQEDTLLLQYPNRARNRPYTRRMGALPENVRIKPESGHLEMDVRLNTDHNFNKYQSLRWGDAMDAGRKFQNASATYGPAAGFSQGKRNVGVVGRQTVPLKDKVDRELEIVNDLSVFYDSKIDRKVMDTQTLGGQIIRRDAEGEQGKPLYFIGTFKEDQLHLTKVSGTAQMRPQFHHIDAEDQRSKVAARSHAMDPLGGQGGEQPRGILQRNQREEDRDRPEGRLRKLFHAAEAETWVPLRYVDEDDDEAYVTFHDKLFAHDVQSVASVTSGMNNEQYLDAISTPARPDVPRSRGKRPPRKKGAAQQEEEDANPAGSGDADEDMAGADV